MKSFKPIIVATAVAACLFGHDASAAQRQRNETVAPTSAPAAVAAPVLIASSGESSDTPPAAVAVVAWDAGKRGASSAALQGPVALRRFIERTRTIYDLQYGDFAPVDR